MRSTKGLQIMLDIGYCGMLMGKAEMFEDNTPMFVMGVNQEKYTKD